MTRPITVLDLRDTDEIGGPGKTILETGRATDTSRFQLHVAVFQTRHENRETPFISAARDYGLPVHTIRGYNQYDPRLIVRTAELVRRLNVDIVHAHEVKSDVIALLSRLVRPVITITTLHGWIGNSRKQRALIGLDRKLMRYFDMVIAVSQAIREQAIAAGTPRDRVRLVHNAIVLDRYRRQPPGALADLLGSAVTGPVLSSIGRLSFEKGHLDLIEALGILARRGVAVTTVLAGDGPARPQIEERIRALGLTGHVHLPGYVARPQDVLNETDLMVLPSHTEGLPNAALEALAMNVPVLATRVGGTPEVVLHDQTGRLVEPHQPEALAREIESFVTNPVPWRELARQGRAHVERVFDFRARTRALEQLYTDLVEGRAS